MTPQFQFQPFPNALYTAAQLLQGFDPSEPETYSAMLDFRIYREFIVSGGGATSDYLTAMSRALHDNGITQHLADFIANKKVVAIMGGHGALRGDTVYRQAALISSMLTAQGFLVASGGGPGVMEAVHLGAAFGSNAGLSEAIDRLSAPGVPLGIPPNAVSVLTADGDVDIDIAKALGEFLKPAVAIRNELGQGGGLGIPTWLYGHEPFTPLAGAIAKYFQNSIREDGLLALATHGVVYMTGSAGTVQEVFQDAAQNCYFTFPMVPGQTGIFSPMVFVGDVWLTTLPVKPVLDGIFAGPKSAGPYKQWVKFTSDSDAVIDHILAFPGKPSSLSVT